MGDDVNVPARAVRRADRSWIEPDMLLNVFEHSPNGLMIGRPDGLIYFANSKACEIFGGSEDELCQAGRAGVSYPGDRLMQGVLEERRQTGRGGGLVPLHRLDGTPFIGEIASVVFDTSEREQRTLVIIRDVTEQVHNERRLAAYDDIAEAVLANTDAAEVLQLVARHARVVFDSDVAVISSVEPDGTVVVTAVDGASSRNLLGRSYPSGGAVQQVVEKKEAVVIEDFTAAAQLDDGRELGLGPAIALPVLSGDEVFGILFLGRSSGVPYGEHDVKDATQFALRVGVVLTVGEARAERERLQARTADQLQNALETRIIIEQAKGFIAATRNIEVDEAFERLRNYARSHSSRIHDVATRVMQRTLLP